MTETVKTLIQAADAVVPRIDVAEARRLASEEGAVLLDVRDPAEVQASGGLSGAVNIPRGMLEFRADPATPYHDKRLQPDVPVVLYCASGGRSALAGHALSRMGFRRVFNLGGFEAASKGGFPLA